MKNMFCLEAYDSPAVLQKKMEAVIPEQVEASLATAQLTEQDLLILLSPAAGAYLETMAQRAWALTRRRFGRIMKLYAPLYLSNECTNACLYCGFNQQHDLARKTLKIEEVLQQAKYLSQQGFQNLLLVSGESRQHVPVKFLAECVHRLKPRFPEISIEVYPLEIEEYQQLTEAGLFGLIIYQETYDAELYQKYHPAGKKNNYTYRLQTPQRGAEAGVRQVGLGVLLGLQDFRVDGYYLGRHARFFEKQFWKTIVGISFPRLRQATGDFVPPYPVSDAQLVQLVTALRLFLPDAPFSLSTREPEHLRKHLLPLGFTQISAGSRTTPGGYGKENSELPQFQVEDTRGAKAIARELELAGFEPIWKDWDESFDRVPAQTKEPGKLSRYSKLD
ncbi:2-iminoacetate synthase ThiH [bacterium]|nr:2-iminoacetate synthase ThiH [bacterium]